MLHSKSNKLCKVIKATIRIIEIMTLKFKSQSRKIVDTQNKKFI